MEFLNRVWSGLRNLLRPGRIEQELDEEIRSYMEILVDEKISGGMRLEEARRAAQIEIGGVEQVKGQVREERSGAWLEVLWQDLRYAARRIRLNPGFSCVAVLTLALGIGANTAVFSVLDAVLLQGLPYPSPERLVMVFEKRPPENRLRNVVSPGEFFDWREESRSFEGLSLLRGTAATVLVGSEPERILGETVSANFFDLLGVKMQIGRPFRPEEEKGGAAAVVVLSHGFWQRRLGSDPEVVGRSLSFDGTHRTVIGVLPATFQLRGTDRDYFIPASFDAQERNNRGSHFLLVLGRLRPDVGLEQARTEMDAISERLSHLQHPVNREHGANIVPLQEALLGEARPGLLLLYGGVGLVLLIACANLANLLLARALTREHEMGVRVALGAGRRRLARQLLTESLLLSLLAGVVGLLMAYGGVHWLKALAPDGLAFVRAERIGVSLATIAYTGAIAVLSGIFFGLAPAWRGARSEVNHLLREGGRSATVSRRGQGPRQILVAAELALSCVLLIGAGLLIRSFVELLNESPGFRPENVLSFQIGLPERRYPEAHQVRAVQRQLRNRLQQLPGVTSVGAITHLPISGADARRGFDVEGLPRDPSAARRAHYRIISPGYVEAMGVPLLAGRTCSEQDIGDSPPVLLVNETAAKRFWPESDALAGRARFSDSETWRQVVGVLGDVRHQGLHEEPRPEAYLCSTQIPSASMGFVVRTVGDPVALASATRQVVRSVDRELPAASLQSMEQVIAASVAARQFYMLLLASFALLALLLAAGGVYGVTAYLAEQRTYEIGIRLALGAGRGEVVAMVLGQMASVVGLGLSAGVLASLILSFWLGELLYGIPSTDPLTFGFAPLLLLCVALAATAIPAWRASRVSPLIAIRSQ